jgi:hypothetical protein
MQKHQPKQKIYCYVDETGQDTEGDLFLVALVVTGQERDELVLEAERIEENTGKGLLKWRKTSLARKQAYLRAVFISPRFSSALFFAQYRQTKGAYIDLMVYATARAILSKAKSNYESVVIVDGLRQKETRHFAHGLRSLHVAVEKVRGMKDESNSLIRLADAIAGFMRDYLEGQPYATELAKSFRVEKIVKELG